jgi:hypothetical protein
VLRKNNYNIIRKIRNNIIYKEMDYMYKNIEKKKILKLKNLVEYQKGQVVSKTLVQNELVSV